jgi:hypothetical protein
MARTRNITKCDAAVHFTMTTILHLPAELIELVVDELDPADHGTLERLALTASTFRHSTQRVLLSSLTLKDGPNYVALATLLSESLHVRDYATRLTIRFPPPVAYTQPPLKLVRFARY